MQLSRYLDLYLTETQEHLRLLDRVLLELEESGERGALEEAFRSVHTIKGMSASMGFAAVADIAHTLEDRLDVLRRSEGAVTSDVVDELLAGADRLQLAVDAAVRDQQAGAGAAQAASATPADAAGAEGVPRRRRRAADAPAGTTIIARVDFMPDAPLVAARARMALDRASEAANVLAADPPDPTEAFDGELTLFLGGAVDRDAVDAAVRSAGEVDAVRWEEPGDSDQRLASREAAVAGAAREERRGRFLRVDLRHIDSLADGIAELAILQRGIGQLTDEADAERRVELQDRAAHLVRELQTDVLAVRMVPVGETFDRFPRVVRDAARRLGREVEFRVEGRGIELDRAILDEIADPLVHLLRNAVGHGIEPPAERAAQGKPERGTLTLSASRERSRVLIEVSDDGRGVDRDAVRARAIEQGLLPRGTAELDDGELLRVMSAAGLSTAERVTEVSGRGVGLDVVVERVRALGGSLALRTEPGRGTTFAIRLPLTLAIAQALRVRIAGEHYVVPLTHVAEAVERIDGMTAHVRGQEVLRLRDDVMPLLRLGPLMGRPDARGDAAVIVEVGERRAGLGVDALVGREQIVMKQFDTARGTLPVFSGATLLADGTPALVLDPVSVTQGRILHG